MPGTPAAQCDYDVVTVAMNTGTGTQAIVGNCGGKTPKGGVILASRAATALGNTPTNGAMVSASVWDAAGNCRLVSCMAENGVAIASANSGRRQATTIVQILTTTTEALDGEASFSSVSADTLTINITDASSTAIMLEVWLFYGDSLQAHVDTLAANGTENLSVTETGIPFQPRVLIALSAVGGFATSATSARHSLGVCAFNDDGTVQGQVGISMFDRNLPTLNTATGGGFRTDAFLQRITVDAGGTLTEDARYEVTAATADGFTVFTRGGSNATNIGYLALYTGRLRAWAGAPSLGLTAVGSKSITDPGFRPRFLACLGSRQTTNNAYVSNSEAIHFGVGAAVSSSQASVCFHCLDQSSPNSVTRSVSDATLATIYTVVGGTPKVDWSATLISFDSSGFTAIVLPASGADRQVGFLALEDGSAKPRVRWRRLMPQVVIKPIFKPKIGLSRGHGLKGVGPAIRAQPRGRGHAAFRTVGLGSKAHGHGLRTGRRAVPQPRLPILKTPRLVRPQIGKVINNRGFWGRILRFWEVQRRAMMERLHRRPKRERRSEPETPVLQFPKGHIVSAGPMRGDVVGPEAVGRIHGSGATRGAIFGAGD